MPISAPSIGAAGSGYDEGGVYVFDGDPSFHWTVEGEVASFTATLYDDQYAVIRSGTVGGNSLNIGASTLEPGRVYTLEIVAQPASGGEATSSTFAFRVAAPVTEAPTEAPTPAPISAPSIGAAGSGYDEGGIYVFDGDPSFQWAVEGEVARYVATFYAPDGSVMHSADAGGTALSVPMANFAPGLDYTLEIVAYPASGGEATSATFTFRIAAQATEAPTQAPVSGSIDASSDPASIQALQQKLFDLGLFTADNAPQPGAFDQRTLEIVLSFQQAYNAQNPGAPLLEVDPTDPNAVIDATTVALIMNAEVPMG